jgi:hypothetical protein
MHSAELHSQTKSIGSLASAPFPISVPLIASFRLRNKASFSARRRTCSSFTLFRYPRGLRVNPSPPPHGHDRNKLTLEKPTARQGDSGAGEESEDRGFGSVKAVRHGDVLFGERVWLDRDRLSGVVELEYVWIDV